MNLLINGLKLSHTEFCFLKTVGKKKYKKPNKQIYIYSYIFKVMISHPSKSTLCIYFYLIFKVIVKDGGSR